MIAPEKLWPAAIVATLALTVAANIVLLRAASDPAGSAVEPDYYRKALAWDSTMAEQAKSSALGWTLTPRLVAQPDGRTRLEVSLTDRDGHAITGATVAVAAIHNLEPEHPETVTLSGDASGYGASLALPHPGLWELRFSATLGANRFESSTRCERPAHG